MSNKIVSETYGWSNETLAEMSAITKDLHVRVIEGNGDFDKTEIVDYLTSIKKLTPHQMIIISMALQQVIDKMEYEHRIACVVDRLLGQG